MHGHLFPIVPILEELRRRGHEVALRTIASEVAMLRTLGFEAEPIAPEIEALRVGDWKARSPVGAAARATANLCDRAEHDARDLRMAIEQERPDALIVDTLSWGALGSAEAWDGPWASFSPLPLLAPSRDVPPQGPGLRPVRGPLGRARDRLLNLVFQTSFDLLVRPRLNAIRTALDQPRLRHAGELFLRPPLLLQMSTEAFEFPRSDWPRNVVLVGPCAWDPATELPAGLSSIEQPLVLVSTSSDFQNDGKLVRSALTALTGEPYHVVATLPAASIEGLRPPPNATVLPFAPHTPILARSVCAITHGGMGVTQKALAYGVPVCAVPFGRDQFDVARRVEAASAGTRLPAWRLRPDRLKAKVREAIDCRDGAKRVAQSFAAVKGPKTAVDAFEQRLLRAG
jgi:MGT family glycosyltransferase